MKEIIVIVGPTGIGKTKLSIMLAKKLDAEIINGDSVSIYKELDIGSAKPTIEERENIPHHLLDIRKPEEEYSVYDYQRDVRKLITDIDNRKKRIIIVGGTGLYIKAALYNYEFFEEKTKNSYENLTNEEIYEKIKNMDSTIDIHVNNRKRLVRTLNRLENNQKISNKKDEVLYPIRVIGLSTERKILYERIDNRVDQMLEDGLLKEIEKLKPYYEKSRVLNTAIGYQEFEDYLFHEKPLAEVIEQIKKDTRNYAKRQYTFFRNQMNVTWFETNFQDFTITFDQVCAFLEKK